MVHLSAVISNAKTILKWIGTANTGELFQEMVDYAIQQIVFAPAL